MARFLPQSCPLPSCPSRAGDAPFRWRRRGTFTRAVDGRTVQRFWCHACRRSFSGQSFRLDYRQQLPRLHLDLFPLFISKVTMRQAARCLKVDRKTVARRLTLLGHHCRLFHEERLKSRTLGGVFQLDELETFETDRRLKPVTVPVLIERRSFFVVGLAVGTLPARGGLTPRDQERKKVLEARTGKRRSESREMVRKTLAQLEAALPKQARLDIQSDQKSSYRCLIHEVFPGRLASHAVESSRAPRNYQNLLFPINHTLAMLRDSVSRLVRRNWAASKCRKWLERHLWIWVAWRNYLRPVTVKAGVPTPGQIVGLTDHRWEAAELLRWRAGVGAK